MTPTFTCITEYAFDNDGMGCFRQVEFGGISFIQHISPKSQEFFTWYLSVIKKNFWLIHGVSNANSSVYLQDS